MVLGRWRGSAWHTVRSAAISVLIVPMGVAMVPARLHAQTASRITPPSFAPDETRSGTSLTFSGRPGLGAPAGAEKLSVRLSGVRVEGAPADFDTDIRALEARLTGRRIPASEIFAAAQALEAAFVRAGYVLTRVVLPVQTVRDGNRLRLVVVSGYVERVDYRNVPDSVRARIGALIESLVGRRDVRLGEIERRLLLAGDTPGVALRSTLTPGSETGGTVLVIDAEYRPLSGFVSVDNTVGAQLGRWTVGTGLDLNSVLGFGETIYGRAFGHPGGNDTNGFGSLFSENSRLRTLSAGIVVPLGTDGLTLNVEGTNSHTTPRIDDVIESTSDYDRFSVRLRYPWLRSRTANVFSELAFEATQEKLSFIVPGAALPVSLDRLRIFRLSTDGDLKLESGGLLTARGTVSFGVDGLGARSAADATPLLPLSRFGADAEFQKLDISATFTQPLADHLVFGLYARGQTSFGQVLARSEQIGIASFQELSTFDAGSLGGDSGWVVRGELSSPNVLPVGGYTVSATPYLFGATGELFLERPTALERAHLQVSSVGLGIRLASIIGVTVPQASLTLEFGRRLRDDRIPDGNRFTLVGALRF